MEARLLTLYIYLRTYRTRTGETNTWGGMKCTQRQHGKYVLIVGGLRGRPLRHLLCVTPVGVMRECMKEEWTRVGLVSTT